MKRFDLIFVAACCVLGCCTCYAKNSITMGNFTAPMGPQGNPGTSGCTPDITVGTKNNSGCYTVTIQKKTLSNGACTTSGSQIQRTICDGAQGAQGCSITASKTITREDPNDSTSRIVKTTVSLHDTCDGDNHENDQTFDVENGEDGAPGTGIYYQTELADCSALSSLASNSSVEKQNGYAWFVKNLGSGYDAGKLYIWKDGAFPDCPTGGVTFQGPQGPQGDGVCTNYENDATAVKNTVRSYTGPQTKTTSGSTAYYATAGKLNLTHKMCKSGVADKVDSQEDTCIPIIAPSGICTSGTYYECTPQGTYTGNSNYSKYNLCKATTGTTIASEVANKADASTVSSLSSTVGDSTSGLVKDVNSLNTTVGSSSSGLVKDVNSLKTTVGSSSSGLVKKANDLETALGNKLDNDVSFSTSGGYIKMTAGGTTVNVATVASLKGDKGDTGNNGASVFDIWKAQQTNGTTCQALFNKTCANLTESDMLQDLSAYGNWARTTYAGNSSADLSQTAYQNSLKPCQSYSVVESDNQSGTNGGKRYDLICNN